MCFFWRRIYLVSILFAGFAAFAIPTFAGNDPESQACALFDVPDSDSEPSLYFIWFQPALILESLELSRSSETKDELEKYFKTDALPYFQTSPTALGDLRESVDGWVSEQLRARFELPDDDDISARIQAGSPLSNQEKALLIYGAAMAAYDFLDSLKRAFPNTCLNAFDAKVASSVAMTEQVMSVKRSFYDTRLILAEAMLQSIAKTSSNDYEGFYSRIVSPYPKIFKGYEDELADISRLAGKRTVPSLDSLSTRTISTLSVMMKIMEGLPPPDVYTWSAEDLSLIQTISANSKGEMGEEVRKSILKNSRAFALANTQTRMQRMKRVLNSNLGTIAIGGAGLALYVMTKDYAVLNKGFLRSEALYARQVELNAPKSIAAAAGDKMGDEIRNLWRVPGTPIPGWANTAAREAILQARFDFAYREAFKGKILSIYGQNAWKKVEPIFNDKVVGAGTKLITNPSMEDLASALAKIERGGMTVRQGQSLIRETTARMEVSMLSDSKAMDKVIKSAHQEMRMAAEAAMGEEFIRKSVGETSASRLGLTVRKLYQKLRGRMAMNSLQTANVQGLAKAPWYNPAARVRNWWGVRSTAASTISEGSAYKSVLPGESMTAQTATAKSMARSALRVISIGMILYSVGKLGYDSYQAFYVRSPEIDFEDLRAKAKAGPMDDGSLEKSFKSLHISSLRADLMNALDHPSEDSHESINESRLLSGQAELEVVVSPQATGAVDRMTGFMDHAYVLFKVKERSKDNTWDLRRQNAITGVLVRFQQVREGTDTKMASALRLKPTDVPATISWEFDKMIVLNGLDPHEAQVIGEAVTFAAARADDPHPEILIDAEKVKSLFVDGDPS